MIEKKRRETIIRRGTSKWWEIIGRILGLAGQAVSEEEALAKVVKKAKKKRRNRGDDTRD